MLTEDVRIGLFKISNPLLGEVIENRRLTALSRGARSDARHLVFRCEKPYPCLPGQSAGILPPGMDPRTSRPHAPRLYSVASPTGGEDGKNLLVSLCVVRHFWDNPKTNERGIPGAASCYLCNLKAGDIVRITGPLGRHFILPSDYQERDLVFVATGTGIAPFRGMLKDIFRAGYSKRVWLIFGAQHADCLLYGDEFQALSQKYSNLVYLKAISREEINPCPAEVPTRENRMYVQVRMHENRSRLLEILSDEKAMIYLCGLKGMEAGIFPVLDGIGKELGKNSFSGALQAGGRLRVEVY